MSTSRAAPYLVVAFGVLLLSIMDVAIKAVARDHATAQIVAMRFLCGLPYVVAFLAWTRPPAPGLAMMRAHLLRGVLVVSSAFLFFYALATLALAEAIALAFLAPLFLSVFAAMFLKEPITARVVIALAIGFLGMAVILGGKIGGGTLTDLRFWGALAAIGCAVTYALNLVLLRARAQTDPMSLILLFQNLIPLALIAPFAAMVWTTPSGNAWLLFLAIGALGAAGHACMAWGFKRASAGPLGVIEYSALVWGSAFGFFVFGEVPGLATIGGALMIVAACVWVALKEKG